MDGESRRRVESERLRRVHEPPLRVNSSAATRATVAARAQRDELKTEQAREMHLENLAQPRKPSVVNCVCSKEL